MLDLAITYQKDLVAYYTYYNHLYFNYTLTPSDFLTLRWNENLGDYAGMCIKKYNETIIELNPIYLTLFPEEFPNIFVHEMIHLISIEHDNIFLSEIERIKQLGLEVTVNCKYKLSEYSEYNG
jgi:predicted SprT family Zn-dependent metalloprotease